MYRGNFLKRKVASELKNGKMEDDVQLVARYLVGGSRTRFSGQFFVKFLALQRIA
jgi:hypothetical protein